MTTTTLTSDPSIAGPKLQFSNNQVVNNVIQIVGSPSAVPGVVDADWQVLQWSKGQLLTPDAISLANPSTFDATLGENAAYLWATPDGESRIAAYSVAGGKWVYDIRGSAQPSTGLGEADLFIQTANSFSANLAAPLTLSLDEKVSEAQVTTAPGVDPTHEVWANSTASLTLMFNTPGGPDYDASLPTFGAFLQILITTMQGDAAWSSYLDTGNGLKYGGPVIANELPLAGSDIPFAATAGAPTHFSYRINDYVAEMATNLERRDNQPAGLSDLSRWSVNGVYLGVGASAGTPGDGITGTASLGVQISNVNLTAGSNDAAVAPVAADHLASGFTTTDGGYQGSNTDGQTAVIADSTSLTAPSGSEGYHDPSGCGAVVENLYKAVFHHPGNGGGIQFWAANVDQGNATMEQTAADFLASPENASLGAKDSAGFVTQTFQGALDRTPDAGALSFYSGLLDSGVSRANILLAVADSPEAQANSFGTATSPDDATVFVDFRTVLGFSPDGPGLQFYGGLMEKGLTATQLAGELMKSPEYKAATASLSDTEFVDLMYQQGLGRVADDLGAGGAVAALASGVGRNAIAAGIAGSAEAARHWFPDTHAGLVLFTA